MNAFMNRNIFNISITNVPTTTTTTTPSTSPSSSTSTLITTIANINNKQKIVNSSIENPNRFNYLFLNGSPMLKKKKLKKILNPIPVKINAIETIPSKPQKLENTKLLKTNFYDEPFVNQSYKYRMDLVKKSSKQEKYALISKFASKLTQQQQQQPVSNNNNNTTETSRVKQIKPTLDHKIVPSKQLKNIDDEMKTFYKRSRKQTYRMSFTNLSTVKEENENDDNFQQQQQQQLKKYNIEAKRIQYQQFTQKQSTVIYDHKKSWTSNDNYKKKLPVELPSISSSSSSNSSSNGSSSNNYYYNQTKQNKLSFTPIKNNNKLIDLTSKSSNSINKPSLQLAVPFKQEQQQVPIRQIKIISGVNKVRDQAQSFKISPSQASRPPPPAIVSVNSSGGKLSILKRENSLPKQPTAIQETHDVSSSYFYSQNSEISKTPILKSDFSRLNELNIIKIDDNFNNYLTHSTSDPTVFMRDNKNNNNKTSNYDTYLNQSTPVISTFDNKNNTYNQYNDKNFQSQSTDKVYNYNENILDEITNDKNYNNNNSNNNNDYYDYNSYFNTKNETTEKSNLNIDSNSNSNETNYKYYDYNDYYNTYYSSDTAKTNNDSNYDSNNNYYSSFSNKSKSKLDNLNETNGTSSYDYYQSSTLY
jgi:hypothetical protein